MRSLSPSQQSSLLFPFLLNFPKRHLFQQLIFHQNKRIINHKKISQYDKNSIERINTTKRSILSKQNSGSFCVQKEKSCINRFIQNHRKINIQRTNTLHFMVPKIKRSSKIITNPQYNQSIYYSKQQIHHQQNQQTKCKKNQPININKSSQIENIIDDNIIKQRITKINFNKQQMSAQQQNNIQVVQQNNALDQCNNSQYKCFLNSNRSKRQTLTTNKLSTNPRRQSQNQKRLSFTTKRQCLSGKRQSLSGKIQSLSIKRQAQDTKRQSFHHPNYPPQCLSPFLPSLSNFSPLSTRKPTQLQQILTSQQTPSQSIKQKQTCIKCWFNPIFGLYTNEDLYVDQMREWLEEEVYWQGKVQEKVLGQDIFVDEHARKRHTYKQVQIQTLTNKVQQQQQLIKYQSLQINKITRINLLEIQNQHDNQSMHQQHDQKLINQHQEQQGLLPNDKPQLQQFNQIQMKQSKLVEDDLLKDVNHQLFKQQMLVKQETMSIIDNEFNQNQPIGNNNQPIDNQPIDEQLLLTRQIRILNNEIEVNKQSRILKQSVYKSSLQMGLHPQSLSLDRMQNGSRMAEQLKRAHVTQTLNQSYYSSQLSLYPILLNKSLPFIDHQYHYQQVNVPQNTKWKIMENNLLFGQGDLLEKNQQIKIVRVLKYLKNNYTCLVQRLFQQQLNGVYACWLYGKFAWQMVYVDAYFPYDQQLNPLYTSTNDSNYLQILLKAISKLIGGYDKLSSLSIQDSFRLILGFVPTSNNLPIDQILYNKNVKLTGLIKSKQIYCNTHQFQSINKGNIVSWRMRIKEKNTQICVSTEMISKGEIVNVKDKLYRRRILVYQITRGKNIPIICQKQMILKHSSSQISSPYLTIFSTCHSQITLPHLPIGSYIIFLQCGSSHLSSYYNSQSLTLQKTLSQSFKKSFNNQQTKYRNLLSFCSNKEVQIRQGKEQEWMGLVGAKQIIKNKFKFGQKVFVQDL